MLILILTIEKVILMDGQIDAKIKQINEMVDNLITDTSIPKNIRKVLNDANERLKSGEELNVKVSASVYLIESISEDINMPAHARTQIWSIIGALEGLKK